MKAYKQVERLSSVILASFIVLVGCSHQVFIVGGMDNNEGIQNTADIFNPTSGSFTTPAGTMSTGRMSATATTLTDSTVLIAGGQGPNSLTTAEIYSPSSGSFSATYGMMNHTHVAHTATLLDPSVVTGRLSNTVLITGGDEFSTVGTAEIYQPSSKTFSMTGNMTTPRMQHTGILISNCGCAADGKVLITGGYDNQFNVLSSAELYDPATQTFTATGKMMSPRFRHTATLLSNGTVLIAGGASQMSAETDDINPSLNTAEIYNPITGKFTQTKGLMNAHREAHAASLLQDGTVLLTGGQDQNFIIENTAELYNPSTGMFNPLSVSCIGAPPPIGCMQIGRDFHISQTLDDGRVLIAGGVNTDFDTVNSAEIYTPSTKTFNLTASMSTVRDGAAASLVN